MERKIPLHNFKEENKEFKNNYMKVAQSFQSARCPRCKQREAYVYLEDYRHKIKCVACGYDDYLKGNQFNKKK